MERKNYMMDIEDLAALRIQVPFVSEATLVRASIKAALKLSKEEFNELCLKAVVHSGRPKRDKGVKNDDKTKKDSHV